MEGATFSDIIELFQLPEKAMKFEEEITDGEAEAIETEAKEVQKYRRPRVPGLMLTIFGAVIVILIGGLASYYYYTFQSQGAAGEKVLKRVWSETVTDTNALLAKFNAIDKFDDLAATGDQSLTKIINQTNQTVRDGLFDVRAQTGLSITASTAASKFTGFLEDYSTMLTELKRIATRAGEVSEMKELAELVDAGEAMSKSYDELLLVGSGLIQAKLPRAVFDIPDGVGDLLQKKIDDGGTKTEQQKAAQQAAEQQVSQFIQAWEDRNPTAMSDKLTQGAKADFSPGIVEDSVDITGFRITKTTVADDLTKITIAGQLDKQTPDKTKSTEDWEFVLLSQGGNWLIDRWQKTT